MTGLGTSPAPADAIAAFDTQRTGRMGELVVELELLKRGWVVGNFNSTTPNSVGWDLFATKGRRSVKIRVKAKRPGTDNFRWGAKANGRVFVGDTGADDDFVIAISFESDGSHRAYILPTHIVETTLEAENTLWLSGKKRDGTDRKVTPMRSIYIDDHVGDAPSRGFRKKWRAYEDAWGTLDGAAS